MNILTLVSNKITEAIVFILGLSAILCGWIICGVELYHVSAGQHKLESLPFIIAGVFMTSGGIIVQTGSVIKAAQFFISAIPGGRRKYDPPITDENRTFIPPPKK